MLKQSEIYIHNLFLNRVSCSEGMKPNPVVFLFKLNELP